MTRTEKGLLTGALRSVRWRHMVRSALGRWLARRLRLAASNMLLSLTISVVARCC